SPPPSPQSWYVAPPLFPGLVGIGVGVGVGSIVNPVVTVTAAVPSLPPAQAVTSADPSANAAKRPARSSVPTSGSEHDQATLTQSISLSHWSKTVATNSRAFP